MCEFIVVIEVCDVVFMMLRRSGGDDGCDVWMVCVKCDFNCEESCEEVVWVFMVEGFDLCGVINCVVMLLLG